MTANAVTSLSLEPPLMIVCFALTARTLAAVQHSGRFGVHFLSHEQEDVAARFASKMPEAREVRGPRVGGARRRARAGRLPRGPGMRGAGAAAGRATT